MNIRIFAFILVSQICLGRMVYADSPLTSTKFSIAYASESIVAIASEAHGVLTTELMEFIIDDKNLIDLKVAVINELGWNNYGNNNSKRLLSYLYAQRFKDENALFQNGSGDLLICISYLRAMDSYFRVSEAMKYIECNQVKNSKSYTFQVISALIRAQKYLDQNKWCKVYQETDNVRKNKSLKKDMKEEAVKIIFEYMDIYLRHCNAVKKEI